MKKLFIPLLALVLIGAGCAFGNKISEPTKSEPVSGPTTTPVKPTETNGQTVTESSSENEPKTIVPSQTDETWNRYNNAALHFSFDWPSRGRYAPEWEVKFYGEKDPKIVDGCYKMEKDTVKSWVSIHDQTFCHSGNFRKTEDGTEYLDAYATKIGFTPVVIHFTKTIYEADESCLLKGTEAVGTTVKGSCALFVEGEYQSTLDGVVGTFRRTE